MTRREPGPHVEVFDSRDMALMLGVGTDGKVNIIGKGDKPYQIEILRRVIEQLEKDDA